MTQPITEDFVNAQSPCKRYPPERVHELFAGRDVLPYDDVFTLDIPAADKVWVFALPGVLPDDVRERWREMFLTRAITNHALTCGAARVEAWAQRWLSGEDRSRDAAHAAAHAAALAAAGAAARAAAWSAAGAAAQYAAWAARDVALDVEFAMQVEDLRAALGDNQ